MNRNPARALLALALAVGVAMTLVLTREMTFFQDTWGFLMERRELSVDALFKPHNEHFVVFPVLIQWLLLQVFGLSSALPEYILLALFLATTALLFFVYLERRVGSWLALYATVIVLCLGPAWEVLLWPFEITFIGPILFGLAMLLALERGDRRGDIAATVFLVLAIGFSGLGICFIAAAIVAVFLGPREKWLARSYVFVVPLLVYAAWYVGWGHDAESHRTATNVFLSPRFVADSLAFAVGSMAGLGPRLGSGAVEPNWGRALLVGIVVALGVAQWHFRRRLDPRLWPIAAAAFANWFLTAFNAFPGRDPSSSRYQYAGAIFVLMILANLLSGVRPGRKVLIAGAVLTALAIAPNLVFLREGRDLQVNQSVLTKADLGAIEIARDTINPDFQLVEPVAGTPSLPNIYAGNYLDAADEYGSPAYTPEELATSAPRVGRHQADVVLANALPVKFAVTQGAYTGAGGGACAELPGGSADPVEIGPGTTRIEVAPGPSAEVSLRRFSDPDDFPVRTGGAPGGSLAELTIPADRSPQPWVLRVKAEQPVRVCEP